MQIRKILVGVDFSEQSEIGVEQALNIARKLGGEIVLLHAGTVPQHPESLSKKMEGAAAHFERLLQVQLTENRQRLEDLRQRIGAGGVRVSHVVLDAFPDTGLATAAKEIGADLVVVGTHGRTGFDRFLMGSVAERTVRLTQDTNVMVARGRGVGVGGYKRILVPVDFSDITDQVIDTAVELAAKGAVVDVFHVWEIPGVGWLTADVKRAKGGAWRDEMREATLELGNATLQRHWREDDVKLTFDQVENMPAHGVQERLQQADYDLVVMGSHGRRGLRRFMLGSVAEATVRYAPCSVVVVHPHPEAGGSEP